MRAIGRLGILGAWSVAGSGALLATMLATNPVAIGPVGVTVWFIGLVTVVASALTLIFYGVKVYFHVHTSSQTRFRYCWRQGWLVAGWICGLLALSSLNQLGWRDVILLGLAAIIVELYVRLRLP